MWEPEDRDLFRARTAVSRVRERSPGNAQKAIFNGVVKSKSDLVWALPPELLILARFGVSRKCLETVWKISLVTGIDAREYLCSAGIITGQVRQKSEALLLRERERKRKKARFRDWQINQAVNTLYVRYPNYSARKTFCRWQLWMMVALTILFVQGFVYDFEKVFLSLIAMAGFFYAGVIFMRLALLSGYDIRTKVDHSRTLISKDQFPIYSILVPLLREASQIKHLVQHLEALDWPKQKLEVKLLCEQDDKATIAAIGETRLAPCFELVVVPSIGPKTKPKALNFGLPLCKGEYVVVYDAEDRPDPSQLKEAWHRFSTAEKQLACLQAPLMINNLHQSWLSRMFFMEYLVLFTGILPALARWKAPIPLGGSSNHFRKNVLVSVGAWDPFNVTEDADLGIRLFREGYWCATLQTPTYEEAPPHFFPWLTQRTRWLKGWMQTLLVHNRRPFSLFGELGFKNALIFHFFLTSIVVSALVHPIFVFALVSNLLGWEHSLYDHPLVAGYGFFCLLISYLSYGFLASLALNDRNGAHGSFVLFTIPLYWMLVSFAAWRALFHLIVIPHRWEKTPHGLANNGDNAYIGSIESIGK